MNDDLIHSKKPIFDLSALNLPDLTDTGVGNINPVRQPGEKFIVFVLGNELFAVSTAQVIEVTHPLAVTPLPNIADWVLGISNLRGEIITAIDLQKVLGEKNPKFAPKSKWIIARSTNSPNPVAFTVDKLSEMITLTNSDIKKTEPGKSAFIFGSATHKSADLHLLDLEKLSDSLEFKAAEFHA